MLLADFIKQKREQLNLSQRQLAKNIGVSQSYVYMVEKGSRRIGQKKIKDFAKALNVEIKMIEKYNGTKIYDYSYNKSITLKRQLEKRKLELDILIKKTEDTLQNLKKAREDLETRVIINNESEEEEC